MCPWPGPRELILDALGTFSQYQVGMARGLLDDLPSFRAPGVRFVDEEV
jgi:hypothetical protein